MGVREMRKMEGPGGKLRFLSSGIGCRLELDVSVRRGFKGEVIGQSRKRGGGWFRLCVGISMGRESEVSR